MHGQGPVLVSSPLGLRSITSTAYVSLRLPDFFHKKVMLHHREHSKHLYIGDIPSPHLTLQMYAPF